MNDNSSITVAAILAHGQSQINEQNRQRDNLSNKLKQNELNEQNNGLANSNKKLNNLNSELLDDVAWHEGRTRQAWDMFRKERDDHNITIRENNYYRTLLSKPMLEIAEANGAFKQTYEMQMAFVADWMVSQKAFKELAIEFGEKQGLTAQEVIEMGKDKAIDVLENKNNPIHITNASDAPEIIPRKELLIERYKQRKADRKTK
jgi:hypothetical protein